MEFRKRTDGSSVLDIFDSDEFEAEETPEPIFSLTEEESARLVVEVLRGHSGPPGPMGISFTNQGET